MNDTTKLNGGTAENGGGKPDSRFFENPDEGKQAEMGLKKRLKYFALRALLLSVSRVATIIPERITYKCCVWLSLYFYRKAPKYRKLARKHLEIAFGSEKPPEEIDEILRQTYINYGMNLAEFLMLTYKSREWVESKVNFNDPNWHIRTQLEKGKGVVGLSGHFGSWELVGARTGIYKYPIVVVVKAQRDAITSKFIMDTRTKWGNEYIFRMRGVRDECMRQLALNKIVGLIADQNVSHGGVDVDFFGKKASTATGPAYIAMKAGIPVTPSFPARNTDGTITLHVFDPIPMRDTGNFDEDLVYNVQLCNKAIEDFARLNPAEYFWWHRRWRSKEKKEQK